MQPQLYLQNNQINDKTKLERFIIMNTEEFTNKMTTLFPEMTNANAQGNTIASGELWKGVADKSTDTIASVVAPIKNFILDVQPDLQVRNPNALPVVQVEVISSMGGALVDNDSWDKSAITNKYVDVKLHRISRPFMLTAYDLMRGERVETKVAAAMKEVAQGVVGQFMSAVNKPDGTSETLSKFDPETCATISGAFGEQAEVDTLLIDPANYAKIVPTNALALNPEAQGTYGIGHIYKSSQMAKANANAIALTKDGVAGAVATPEIVQAYSGQGMQYLGEVGGIPMVLISSWDYDKQAVKCSVETMAGFTVTDDSKVKGYKIG